MKKLLLLVSCVMFVVCTASFTCSMGTRPPEIEVPDVPDVPEVPTITVLVLEDYEWENSDSIANKSYIGLKPGMEAKSVKVDSENFVYRQTWHTGRQLWYGPAIQTFPSGAEIVVNTTDGKVYSSIADTSTDTEPEVEPPVQPPVNAEPLVGYKWEESDSYPGQSYVMLPSGLKGDSVDIAGKAFSFKMHWKTGEELWYGPSMSTFKSNVAITVVSVEGKKYSTSVDAGDDTSGGYSYSEQCNYRGRTNGNRPTWYCSKKMSAYPSKINIYIPTCTDRTISNNGTRFQDGSFIVKQSDVSGRGIAILINAGCNSDKAYIRY